MSITWLHPRPALLPSERHEDRRTPSEYPPSVTLGTCGTGGAGPSASLRTGRTRFARPLRCARGFPSVTRRGGRQDRSSRGPVRAGGYDNRQQPTEPGALALSLHAAHRHSGEKVMQAQTALTVKPMITPRRAPANARSREKSPSSAVRLSGRRLPMIQASAAGRAAAGAQ
jgi:hypothetical protein